MTEEPQVLRWVIASMKGTDGRIKPIGVWVSNDDSDIFGDIEDDGEGWIQL